MRLGLDFFFFLCYNTRMENKTKFTKKDWIECILATVICVVVSIVGICHGLVGMGILTF
jgi:hypothetical protein